MGGFFSLLFFLRKVDGKRKAQNNKKKIVLRQSEKGSLSKVSMSKVEVKLTQFLFTKLLIEFSVFTKTKTFLAFEI